MHTLADRVLAQDCALCGARSGGQMLCTPCDDSLPRLTDRCLRCPRCAMPSASGEACGRCLKRAPHFDATHAVLRYGFPADRVILSLKYGANLPAAAYLAQLLAQSLRHAANARNVDLVLAMPLHRRRLAQRGFNQSVEIGRRVARELDLPFSHAAAVRVRDTPPQADLPLIRRRANVRGAFDCTQTLDGRSVAVIDDVMTSGATVDELAKVLKRAGAMRVENWVVARTWPRSL